MDIEYEWGKIKGEGVHNMEKNSKKVNDSKLTREEQKKDSIKKVEALLKNIEKWHKNPKCKELIGLPCPICGRPAVVIYRGSDKYTDIDTLGHTFQFGCNWCGSHGHTTIHIHIGRASGTFMFMS